MNTKKKTLFIFRSHPDNVLQVQEGIDAVLAAAVFDQEITILFMSEGVLQLTKKSDDKSKLSLSNFAEYDIDAIFADQHAIDQHSLLSKDFCLKTTAIDNNKIKNLIFQQAATLTY